MDNLITWLCHMAVKSWGWYLATPTSFTYGHGLWKGFGSRTPETTVVKNILLKTEEPRHGHSSSQTYLVSGLVNINCVLAWHCLSWTYKKRSIYSITIPARSAWHMHMPSDSVGHVNQSHWSQPLTRMLELRPPAVSHSSSLPRSCKCLWHSPRSLPFPGLHLDLHLVPLLYTGNIFSSFLVYPCGSFLFKNIKQ